MMKKYILSAVALALIAGLLLQNPPGLAREPQLRDAPHLAAPAELPPTIHEHGTGFIAPPMDLSHLNGQRMPDTD